MTALPPCIDNLDAGHPLNCGGKTYCAGQRYSLASLCQARQLSAEQQLFIEGDLQNQVYVVVSGAVRLYKLFANGKRQILDFRYPGEFVALTRRPCHSFSAQAIVPTQLRTFASAPFYALAEQSSAVLLRLYDSVTGSLGRAYDLASIRGQQPAESNIAIFLLEAEARARQDNSDVISLPMPRADIADYLGVTKETVSRILTRLERQGVIEIVARRQIRLKKLSFLQNLAK